jgi:hypothetical protein
MKKYEGRFITIEFVCQFGYLRPHDECSIVSLYTSCLFLYFPKQKCLIHLRANPLFQFVYSLKLGKN